jgi:HK97 gp10 family phage protein
MARAKERVLGVKELTGYFRALAREAPGKITAQMVREGAEVILDAAKSNVRANFENQTGALENSGKVVLVNQFSADIRFDIVYSAVHEYGLDNQVITPRQRAFFYAKYKETGNEMWFALYLSKTYTIPARPYLRPAIDSHQKKAADVMAKSLRHAMAKHRPKAVSGGRVKL